MNLSIFVNTTNTYTCRFMFRKGETYILSLACYFAEKNKQGEGGEVSILFC